MKYFSKIILFMLIISILFSFSGCNENKVVGSVNGAKITSTEYKFFLENTKAQILMESGISVGSSEMKSQISKYWNNSKNKSNTREKTYNNLVKFKIQYANAKKNNFKLSKKDKVDFNNKFAQQYEGNKDFKNHLDEVLKMKIGNFKKLTYKMFYVNRYVEQEKLKIKVTDSEIQDYYDKNKDKYDSTTVRHILLLTQQRTAKEKKAAKKKAEDYLKQVQNGADMALLAENNSEDPGAAQNKGSYEVKKDGQTVKQFEDWAMNAKIGDTGIIKTTYGYHVMKCEKKSTFDDIKFTVKETIQNEKYLKKINSILDDKNNKIKKDQKAINSIKFE